MKPDGALRHFFWAFVIALVGYAIFYSAIEHRRTRRGPWQVTFASTNNAPTIIVNQPMLGLTNAQIAFLDVAAPTNNASTLIFSQPRQVPYEVPFGSCVFMDTTFLPGTVTFRLFGHEIELLPRVLIIDHEEHRWVSESSITPHPTTVTK